MSILHRASLTDRIPPEIWLEIFHEACADTGLTGRSLASVSRFFSSVSQPVKYQSLALHGLHQILAFVPILTAIPAHLRTVKYFFITERQLRSSHIRYDIDDSWGLRAKKCVAFRAILTAIAPTIEILHIDFAPFWRMPVPFPSFPRLRDLQSDSRFIALDTMDTIANSTWPCALLPALRTWNITTVPPWDGTGAKFLPRLAALAPSLSHIRVEKEWFGIGDIMSDYVDGSWPSLAPLPSSIQKLYVKPVIFLPHPAMFLYHACIMRSLKDLNARGDARFVLLAPNDEYSEYSKPYTVGGWLERVDGGEGCWSLREKVFPGEEPSSFDIESLL